MACTRSPNALVESSILFKYANIASLDVYVRAGPESGPVDDNERTLLTVSFAVSCIYEPLLSEDLFVRPVLILALADAVTFFLAFAAGTFFVLGMSTIIYE